MHEFLKALRKQAFDIFEVSEDMPKFKIGIPPFEIEVSDEDSRYVWNRILKPSFRLLVLFGTLVVPIGIIVWIALYRAAENSPRLTEPEVFVSLLVQATLAITLYAMIWGMWLFPSRLRPLILKQKTNARQLSDGHKPAADNKRKSNDESSS